MTSDRTVVLVHGVPETPAIWRPLTAALAERGITDVRAVSPPGFGVPVPAGFDPSMDAYAGWLLAELDAIASDGVEIDVVGHDWGTGHVMSVLAQRPDVVRTWATDVAGIVHDDYVWHDTAQAWQTPDVGEEVIAGMTGAGSDERIALFRSLGIPDDMAPDLAAGLTPEMGRCILALYRSGAQPAMGELGARVVEADRPPGLVIDAPEDPYIGRDLSLEMANRLGAETLTLDGRSHWWMVSDVDPVADALADFWSRH